MLWSGSSPLSVVRDGMWGFLLFAGVAWLAIAWSVLRLEPTDIVNVAGPVILFGALTEAVRALAGTRTWWLNAGMAALFAASGVIMLVQGGSSWTTPAALIGWFLMVRGAADVAISMVTRESDRIWGLLMVVGVAELGLGFFAASSFARTAELVAVVLGGAALARAVADLVAALRLREASVASVASRAERLLELPAERVIGVAGYAAGMTDFEVDVPGRAGRPRHRATVRGSAAGMTDLSAPGQSAMSSQGSQASTSTGGSHSWGEPIGSGASAGSAGSGTGSSSESGPASWGSGTSGPANSDNSGSASWDEASSRESGPASSGEASSGESGSGGGSFHDEVLRTTADLDAMLALAGVTGAAVPGAAARAARDEQVEVPDTAEGAELPSAAEAAAAAAAAQRKAAAAVEDRSLPLLDPAARAAEAASP
ncbi:MAG: hypothetical protein ABW000_16830, partial [Actinoplanes sp.]